MPNSGIHRRSRKLMIQRRTLFMMLNLSLALFLLNGFLLISFFEAVTTNPGSCTAIAILLHFSLFASLCWMMAEAFILLLATAKVGYSKDKI